MKSLELQPTVENLLKTYKENTIGRNSDLHYFVDILDSLDDSCTIALDGSWGSGKTFFVKQSKIILDSFNPFITLYSIKNKEEIQNIWKGFHSKAEEQNFVPQVSVYYDAWENDNDDDPLISLIYTILQSVNSEYKFEKGKDCVSIAAGIFELVTGRSAKSLIEAAKEKDDLFAKLKSDKGIQESINEFLLSLLPEQGDRLVVFIDELDRCKPSFAIKLLERIKHYFSNNLITFVLSINSFELQNTIKQYYGTNFDACKYLDRFFDLRIGLPPADMQRYYQSIDFDNNSYDYDWISHKVITKYHFTLREIAKYVRFIKIAAYEPTHESRRFDFSFDDGKGRQFCLLCLVPVMLGLKMHSLESYRHFIEGKDSSPLIEIIGDGDIGKGICNSLLCTNESFDEEDSNKTIVKLSDKLQEIYEAIFNTDYSGAAYQTSVGKLSFDKNAQYCVNRAVSLLSNYATYSS